MLKRLSERTSVYNVDRWNRDYSLSQYYKKNLCQYQSIDFNKTQRKDSYINVFAAMQNKKMKKAYSKTHYSGIINNNSKIKKKFEDFSYKDLQIIGKSKSEIADDRNTFNYIKMLENGEKSEREKKQVEKFENDKEDNNNTIKSKNENEQKIKEIEKELP